MLPNRPSGVYFINALDSTTAANAARGLCENEILTPFESYRVRSRRSLLNRIAEWGELNRIAYSLLFINCHGHPGFLELSDGTVSLTEMAIVLDGNAAGRWIHFSSCSTLGSRQTQPFIELSGAYGISGFTKPVTHFDSLSIEIQLIKRLFVDRTLSEKPESARTYPPANGDERLAAATGFYTRTLWSQLKSA